jgi:hypothetical protein
MMMSFNFSLNQPVITKIVKIAFHLNFIKTFGIFLKSFPKYFTEMRYDVFPCRYGYYVYLLIINVYLLF